MDNTPRSILINIGNTHVQVAMKVHGGITLLEVYDTPDIKVLGLLPILENMPLDWHATAVSVVPQLTVRLAARYAPKIRFLSIKDFNTLDFAGIDTTTLGMDRIANAAAAHDIAKSAAVVIDFGTCINTVAVSADGRFLGGAILPGRMLLRKSLSTYTSQLPFLPMRSTLPKPVAGNTLDAMAAGVDLGAVGTVRHILAATRDFIGTPCDIITAGGDAPFFVANIPELKPGPELLTLRGVALAAH